VRTHCRFSDGFVTFGRIRGVAGGIEVGQRGLDLGPALLDATERCKRDGDERVAIRTGSMEDRQRLFRQRAGSREPRSTLDGSTHGRREVCGTRRDQIAVTSAASQIARTARTRSSAGASVIVCRLCRSAG
jgi:hypothetical protein